MASVRYVTKCRDCNVHTSELVTNEDYRAAQLKKATDGARFLFISGFPCVLCRGCEKPLVAKRVLGKFSAVHICSAKCLNSKGASCECSCGGVNHGAAHAR